MELWDASHAVSRDNVEDVTAKMLLSMLRSTRSLPLVLVRSPADCRLDDPAAPHLSPGLYVGNFGRGQYGQFRHEVILVEYRECTAASVGQLFSRPFEGGGVPGWVLEALEGCGEGERLSFLLGTKVTGDVHVPAGQASFVALLAPPPARERLCRAIGAPLEAVVNRASRRPEAVRRSWPGCGTLADPGFHAPRWSRGSLVQLEAAPEAGAQH